MKEFYNKYKNLIYMSLIAIVIIVIIIVLSNKEGTNRSSSTLDYYHNYGVNEVVPQYVTEEDMAQKYLADYIGILNNNPKRAYEYLESDFAKTYFPTYNDYYNYISDFYNRNALSTSIKKYSIVTENNNKYYYVVNSTNILFIFKENSIMNYEVLFDKTTLK